MALTPFDGELDSPAGLQSFTGKLDGESKDQDSALVRGTKNAWNSIKTGGALLTGDADLASQLAAERDSYRRANPGTKEGNELMKAWESGDGISGGISNVAGEISKDWREAPGVMAGIRETGKNLSAMGGGIVEQIPNMVAPMGGMLAGGAAGSMAGPIGTVGGAWAGATAGNTLVESGEQVDRALMAAGINPQDKAAVRDFLAKNGDTVLGQAGTKGAIIGAVDTATLGLGGALLRAPAKAAIERAVASGINPADNLAIKAAVNADPVYLASQKGVSALGRNATVAGLAPAGEFAGEYLGQGVATGDWDTKGAALEALSSLGQSGITFAGQKIYDAATSPLRKSAPKEQAPAAITPEDTAQMNALNADLGGAQFNYENIIPSEQKLLPPGVITVPNNAGGETVIDASAGPIQGAAVAAVTNSTIAEDIASGIPLKGYAPDQAKAELASRPDAERYEIRPHPVSGDRGRVAIVPKSAQALAEIDAKASAGNEAMARSEQLAAEEGARKQQAQVAKDIQAAQKQVIDLHRSAASIEKSITPSTPPQDAAIAREQAAELRSQAAAIQTQIQTARAAATQQATQGVRQRAEQNAPATEQALAQDAAQQELAPAVAQPLSETPANQAIAKQRTQHATQQAGVRAQQLAQEEVGDQPAPTVKVPRPMKVGGLRAARYSDEQLQSVVDNDSVPATSRRAAAAEIAWRQAEAEAAAQAEIAKSTGKASTRRAGESESDWLYRKAAEKNKAKAEQQRPSEPVSEVDAKDLEVVGRAVTPTGDLGLSIIREDAMPDMDKAGPKEVSKQSATFLRHVAKLFGKEIVFVGGMNEDGFYQSGNKIYLSTKSNINQLRVLGHEMLHALKRQNRASYDKLLEAVGAIATDAQLKAQFKDYFALDAEMNQKTGAEIDAWLAEPKNREMILEEMMADLSGNRWAESSFWESVFTKIDAKYGSEQAKGIIAKLRLALVAALNKLMSLVKGGQFSVDARVSEHLESIREALATGFADYAKAVKDKQVSEGGVGEVKFSGKQTNIENLKKLMTDREKSKVGKRNAERIVELFNVMPSEKEMAAVAYAGKAKRGWYKNSANALTHLFGSEARRFAGLLAALSPQVSVEVNTRNALRMWANWDASGRPTDKPSIMRLLGQSVEGSGTEASVMGAWVNNSMDALTIQNLDNLTLSGPKVNSFMLNLVGNWEEVTNDAWVANYALVDQNLFSGTGKSKDGSDPGKGAGYLAMNVKTRMAAKILSKETGVTWAPAEVQETIWSWAKTMLETLDASGETRTAKQLMDDGVITDDLIAATPDFELLFRQEPYAGILRNAGMGSKLNSMPMPKHEDPGRAPFADEKRQSLLDEAARRIEFLQRQRRTNMQISWEAKPGRSTGILPNIFNAPLHIQQQYLADIFAEFDMLQVGKKLGIDMRRTLFGPSAWKGDVAAGAQTILQKIGIVADNMGSVKVDADSRKNLEVAASILGYVLNQEGVYWHYPIYRAPDNHAMYPTGVEVNFGRSLTTAEVAEFYGIVSRLAKHQDWAPANTPTGVRFLNFTSFNDNPAQQFDHAQFRAIIKRASGRLKSWADGAQLRDFTFDGDAIENNWKENPNGEDYRSRVGKAGRSDLLKWADDQLSPAIDRVNKRYADQYGWGPASRLERDAAATGATPDNFSARFSPARSDAAGNERAGGRDAAATGKLASYGQPSPGAVSVQGFHYSGTERKQLDGRYYGTGAKGREADRVFAADDKRLRERIYFYVDAGKGVTPEQGVGANGHTVNLNNLYDADKDGFVQLGVDPALRSNDEAWMNAFESAVIDAGFDGYLRDFGTQRAAVLIGRHSVPVTYVGTGKQTGAVNASEAQKPARRTDLPLGQMTGAEWKKLEPRATDLEDGKRYYRSDIKFSPAREYIAEIEGRLAKIKASDNQGGLSMVEANLANIKRGLAGEIVRDEQGNLLAPNGRKSKLTEQQYLQVRSDSFRKWFGDWLSFHNAKNGNGVWTDGDKAVSKIVDENGEPLVVYHGTEKGGFTTMRPDRGDKHRSPMLFAAATRQTARTYSWKGDEINLNNPVFEGTVIRKVGKDWFVMQKNGDPSMAYNVYGEYTDIDEAEGYVSKKEAEFFRDNELEQYLRDNGDVQAGIYSLYLNIRDPYESDFEGANWDGNTNDMFEVLGEDGDNIYADDGRRLMPQDEAEALAEQNEGAEVSSVEWIGETTNTVAEEAKQYGQDGAIIRSVEDDGGRYPGGVLRPDDVFVFFDSNQAKSATQNTGAFSQKNDDLRRSLARKQTETPEFKRWFGDSKVVDADGKPLVVGSSASLQQPGFTVTPKMSGPLPLFSTRRIVGDSGRQYDQTQRDFFKDVGRDIEQKNLVERTLDFLNKDFSKKMAVGLVDQFRGLRDLGDNGQAYMLARLSKGTAGAFDALLHHGKLSLKNGVYDADTSGGFVQRLGAPLNGELDDFLWYVAANRAEKLMPSDREHLFTPAHIAAGKSLANGTTNWDYTIQTGPQAGTVTRVRKEIFDDANRVFNEFQKNTLDMAEQSGLIDGTSRKYWESEFYVPFYRVSEEDNEFIGAKMGDALVRQQAFKKLKGGTDKLNSDLLSNTLLNFSHLIEASAKNRAAKASLGAAEQIGAAQRVAPDMASYAASNGTMLPPGTKKTVWFQENGQKVEYKVTDPFVMTAITSLEYAGMRNVFMDALSKFKHWLTIGVTASPAFKVRNLIRDSLQAIGTSNLSYNPIANVREGFRQTKRDSQEYVSALASGALIRFGTMLEGNESARTRQLIRSGVKDSTILNSEGKWQKFYDKVLEPGITAYNELGNRSEEINRAALYNQLIRQGKSHAEAALLARDLMDFSMQGSFNTVRFLTQVVPFMNARLQGMYKLGRASKDNPRKMAVVTGAVAMASIALMLAYEDDDEWKRREPWDRDNYWWFKVGGEEFRIPKPFELGAIASMAERGLEYMINDEMTGERFLKETRNLVLNQLAMNPVPQAVKPIIDLYANKDSFTGRPIESMSMQRLDPTMRYNSNTSMTARAASNAVGGALSPVQVDHLVRGYFAWLGAFVNGGADMAWRAMSNEPTKPTMDYWKFATQGIVQETDSAGSRYVTQVYEQAKELERAHATWKRLIKDGKVEEATAYREDHADELRRYKQVEAVKKIESNLNDRIHRIEISAIDPDLKKEQINNIKRMKEAAAKRISPGAY